MKYKVGLAIMAAAFLGGCQSPANVKQLQDQNQSLQSQLHSAQTEIALLRHTEQSLRKDIDELNRVIGVLDTEKSSRVAESSNLRGSVRTFVQGQIDLFKDFLVAGNLLDYVGGELVERQRVDNKPLMLVDLDNPMPKNGVLTGLGAHFSNPSQFSVKVLRPVENKLVVIWESGPLEAKQPGINRVNFPVSIGVEQGDVMGYYFPAGGGISFDTGTGDTRYLSQDVGLGGVIRLSSLQGESKRRAYSVGVFGLLN